MMKSEDYQGILERNLLPSVRKLDLRQRSWANPKVHIQKHKGMVKKKNLTILNWPAMNPDLNQIENFWREQKSVFAKRAPANLKELEHIAVREQQKLPADSCEKLPEATRSYEKFSGDVIVGKASSINY